MDKQRTLISVLIVCSLAVWFTGCGGGTGNPLVDNGQPTPVVNGGADISANTAIPAFPEDRAPSADPPGDPYMRVVAGSDYFSMLNGTVDGTSLVLEAPTSPPENAWAVYKFSYLLGLRPLTLVVETIPLDLDDQYYVGVTNYTRGTWEWFGPTSIYEFEVDLSASGDRYISVLGNFYSVLLCEHGNTVTHLQTTLLLEPAAGNDPPDAPTGLTATDGDYSDRVEVDWQEVANATGYGVWRTGYVAGGPDEDNWELLDYTDSASLAELAYTAESDYLSLGGLPVSLSSSLINLPTRLKQACSCFQAWAS